MKKRFGLPVMTVFIAIILLILSAPAAMAEPSTNQSSNTFLYASSYAPSFTVTFEPGKHGTLDTAGAPAIQSIHYGEGAVAPTVIPEQGYRFTGWDKAFNSVKENITVSAQYAALTYTVRFVPGLHGTFDGGTDAVQTVSYGNGADAPAVIPEKGYSFTGWDQTFSNVTEDITVTAQYALKTVTVKYSPGLHGAFDKGVASVQTVPYGSGTPAPAVIPDKGYTFTGWDKPFKSVTDDITVTAQYAIKTYTVRFDPGQDGVFGKGVAPIQTVTYGGAAKAPTITPAEGYSFTGWDKKFDNVTGNMTVTAQYTMKTYTVTFDPGVHGSLSKTSPAELNQKVEYGGAATAPAIEAGTGYTFSGWDGAYENITADATITAIYVPVKCTLTVTIPGNGTTSGIEGSYDFGTVVNLSNGSVNPDTGYRFAGFKDESGNAATQLTMTGDRAITAVFEAIKAEPSGSAVPAVTQNIDEAKVPLAGLGKGTGSLFSSDYVILVMGAVVFLLIILFIILFIRRKRKKEKPTMYNYRHPKDPD